MLALLLVAGSLGLSNFAAAIGLGIGGTSARRRLELGLVFGLFEAGMPVAGLALGHRMAGGAGHTARWLGPGLLVATGVYGLVTGLRSTGLSAAPPTDARRTGRLVVSAAALSIDNLAVGFALGTYHVGLVTAAVVIGAVSVTLSLIGLELGARIGAVIGRRGELLGSVVLIAVGAAIAAGVL